MALIDIKYKDLLQEILENGYTYDDPRRKGVKRIQIDDYKINHSFGDGFPAITTKKLFWKGGVGEMISFLTGSTDVRVLWKNSVNFWDKDWRRYQGISKEEGDKYKNHWLNGGNMVKDSVYDLGKIYSHQLRNFDGKDQIVDLVDTLRNDPMATKKTVSMWQPNLVSGVDMCLSQCHWSFEALVRPLGSTGRHMASVLETPEYGLTLKFNMHSVDTFLGLPMNLVYYSSLCNDLANLSGMKPLGVIADLTNVHLYTDHIEQAKVQLSRDTWRHNDHVCLVNNKPLSKNTCVDTYINESKVSDYEMKGYSSYPRLSAEMLTYSK